MRKIYIKKFIHESSLGDYWKSNYDTAIAFADYIRSTWTKDLLTHYSRTDTHIFIDIAVIRKPIDMHTPITIDIDNGDIKDRRRITRLLTNTDNLWIEFITTDIADKLSIYDSVFNATNETVTSLPR